jgi:lipopolysaccharide transport system ATP-binding protein
MSTRAIEVENLSKLYLLGDDASQHRVSEMFMPWRRLPNPNEFWALKDISFNIEQGESVGIIGRNGAGKSTLLKILSRITAPTTGRVQVRGRVGTLLEVGTGFHPELSGRDNIFLSGTILGLRYAEVKKHLDEIIDFSGVEKFIDTPVKRYSSGMQVKLAFAVALYLEPEVLIVDEVLAVGDLAFQRKSLNRLNEVTGRDGRTVLFVSHSLESVRRSCQRVIVLENGQLKFDGTSEEGVEFYRDSVPFEPESVKEVNMKNRLSRTTGAARFTRVDFLDSKNEVRRSFRTGETAVVRVGYEVLEPIEDLMLNLRLFLERDDAKSDELMVGSIYEVLSRKPLAAGEQGLVEFVLPDLKLRSVVLDPLLHLGAIDDKTSYDIIDTNVNLPQFVVRNTNFEQRHGIVTLAHEFRRLDPGEMQDEANRRLSSEKTESARNI